MLGDFWGVAGALVEVACFTGARIVRVCAEGRGGVMVEASVDAGDTLMGESLMEQFSIKRVNGKAAVGGNCIDDVVLGGSLEGDT